MIDRAGQVWDNVGVTFVVLSSHAPRLEDSLVTTCHRVAVLDSDLDRMGRPFFPIGSLDEWPEGGHEGGHAAWERHNAFKRIA